VAKAIDARIERKLTTDNVRPATKDKYTIFLPNAVFIYPQSSVISRQWSVSFKGV
jgi:hypothetical protein